MLWSTHPAEEIMDYLHMQLCLRQINKEHLAEGEYERKIRERCSHLASVTQTPGCVKESVQGVVLGGDNKKVETVLKPLSVSALFVLKCVSVPPGQARGDCCPPAALSSCRLSQSLHLQSNSIKSRPVANKPWQILSFGIHFGTAVVPSKLGDGVGEASSQ